MSDLLTARLVLRPYAIDDLPAFIALHGMDEVVGMLQSGVETPEQARRSFELYGQSWHRPGIGVWALFDRADGRLIGECGLRRRDDGQGYALRYALLPSHRRRGLAGEALDAAMTYAFETAGLLRVIGIADLRNRASCRVMERARLALERVVSRADKALGFYALTRREWRRHHAASDGKSQKSL
jgi:RimJ/RimL family protein N-acetyltransferase